MICSFFAATGATSKNPVSFCHGRRSRKATTSTQYLNAPTKMRTSELAAVRFVGWFSTAGAGGCGSRFVPRWFFGVFFWVVFFGSLNRYIPSKDVNKGCLHPDFLWEDNYVCQNGVRFPGERLVFFLPFVFGFTDRQLT